MCVRELWFSVLFFTAYDNNDNDDDSENLYSCGIKLFDSNFKRDLATNSNVVYVNKCQCIHTCLSGISMLTHTLWCNTFPMILQFLQAIEDVCDNAQVVKPTHCKHMCVCSFFFLPTLPSAFFVAFLFTNASVIVCVSFE